MIITINDISVTLPTSISEVTLGQRIDYHIQYGHELDLMAKSIIEMEDEFEKEVELSSFLFEKMFRTFAFFTGCTVESIKESDFVDQVASIYHEVLAPLIDDTVAPEPLREFTWNEDLWVLQEPELKHGDKMSFGELIDSKQVVKDMIEAGKGKWEYMLYICAIYLRKKDEDYDESFLYEGSDRMDLMKNLPMDIATQVLFFFEAFNKYLQDHFEIFFPSRTGKAGKHARAHFEMYGWINFLKTIAKTKVFDVPGSGKNSIQCAREARCFDVLVFAGEEKSLNESQYLDYEAQKPK